MNVWDIVEAVGMGLASAHPMGALAIGAVNAFLPDDAKLPENATGTALNAAIEKLNAEQKTQLASQKLELQITEVKEGNATLRTMLESDAKNPHSTRPLIALMCGFSLCLVDVLYALGQFYSIVRGDSQMVAALNDALMGLSLLNGTIGGVLAAYFGNIRGADRDKMNAASGYPINAEGMGSFFKGIVK